MKFKEFLFKAFVPYQKNPGWNINAIITIIGLGVWAIVTLGNAFGIAIVPSSVSEIGSMIFGVGIGRASKETE